MVSSRKTRPLLGFKSLGLALLLEAGLFAGLSKVFWPMETEAAPRRNLAWVPEDSAEALAEEAAEGPLPSPSPPKTSPLPRARMVPHPLPLPPLFKEPDPHQPTPFHLPWRPDPLDTPVLTRRLKPLKNTPKPVHPEPKEIPASPSPTKARSRSLSPVEGWNPKPPYPRRAIRLGQEGSVQLELVVNSQGRVVSVRILQGSGSPLLDLVSKKTLATWRYDGGPGRVRERVIFRLRGTRGESGVEIELPQERSPSPNPRSRR
ncbi:MAG TPA: TonB family protein [Planctomycetes bacterium]|nr:TonB family protein [Planctomycetota bacterium]